jgi:hypothetical protein
MEPNMQTCERCGGACYGLTCSMFNEQNICQKCEAAEREHAQYAEACAAEETACKDGEMNFRGIGVPAELRRAARRR